MKTSEAKNHAPVITGAEAIIRCLVEEQTDLLFGYPGGAIMPVYDALYDYQNELKHVLTRHEQGATHAAQGYARASQKVGVCLATSGPGATNLITGIADAQIDSTPIVCITGQVPDSLLGTDAFQETDIIGISTPVTKWNYQITKASEIPAVMAKAFYIAQSGRPGPVLIDITKNAQFEELEFVYEKCTELESYSPHSAINFQQIHKAVELIHSAQQPLILFGQGVTQGKAETELKAFIEKTGIPAAATIMGLSALETDHPLYVGMLGMHGNYAPNKLTNESDLLIAIGMRFDDRVTGKLDEYALKAKVIHIEIDPSEISKNVLADVPLLGNCKEIINVLLPLVPQQSYNSWVDQFHQLKEEEKEKVIEQELYPQSGPITMGEVIHQLNLLTQGNSIVVTDVGQHQMIACRYALFKQKRSMITSGGLGTMGFCLPAALGAKLAQPEKEVIAIIGDGGFQMTIQELGTIFQTKAAVKIIILNNQFLGMVRQWQDLFFDKRYSATEMVNPNFQSIATGYGIPSAKVETRDNLIEQLREMYVHQGAYLLEIMVGKEDNVFPMVPSGTAVSAIRLE